MNTTMRSSNEVNFIYTPAINYAFQQNHVPTIRELTITNKSEGDWKDIILTISSEPDFAEEWKAELAFLGPLQSQQFTNIPLLVSTKFLAELTEKIKGNLKLTIRMGDEITYQETYPIEILPFDQWPGVSILPEIMAAFVTPNNQQIPKIIHQASSLLGKWTGNPSFDEYQSRNPNRVRKQMAAIFETIANLQIVYCSVPASFEEEGQRIRLADAIFENKLANCLDLSLLYAACLEAVGIHAVIVVVKGHAFTGAWLIEESFADVVNDDPSLLTKRIADGIGEMCLVEATCMNAGKEHSFDQAASSAEQKMTNTADFVLFVDIKRARFGSIRPLPLRTFTNLGWQIEEEVHPVRENDLPEDISIGERLLHTDKIEVSKQLLWERKLLDLTLRNSLLNTRITKSVIQFMTINCAKLEDALANGDEFQVLAKPSDWNNPVRDAAVHQALHHSDPIADLVKHELSHKRLRSYLSENEIAYGLTHLYRASRTALEENGANTLYVALGMLKWYETDASEKPRFAPILLLPVEIIRKTAQKGYIIRSREEETILNVTLLEMLRQDFGISVGGLENLPRDESGVDVKSVFNIIRQAIMAKSKWDIEEQALLGTFSFSKFILWNDIHKNADQLCKNKVVASLVSGKLEWEPEENASIIEISDAQLHPSQIALPISTDSSQLQAILSAAQGKSFILHGPPGTGKSQTITNIIANALYMGKKVLFVAAKKAALDVVESRLESIGIGPFCLELHSNKSKKSDVLQQLKIASEVPKNGAPEDFTMEAERLYQLRNELNSYVETLHQKNSFGYSLFELFTEYSKINAVDNLIYFPTNAFAEFDKEQLRNWQDTVEEISAAAKMIGKAYQHALSELAPKQYFSSTKQETSELLNTLSNLLKEQIPLSNSVKQYLKLEDTLLSKEEQLSFNKIIELLVDLPDLPASMFETDSFEQVHAQVIGLAAHGLKRDELKKSLLATYSKEILSFSAQQTLTQWNIAAENWFLPRWIKQNSLLKPLKKLSLSGNLNKNLIADTLQQVIDFQTEQEHIDKASFLHPLLGFMWKDGQPDWNAVAISSAKLIQINKAATLIIKTGNASIWRKQLGLAFREGSKSYLDRNSINLKTFLLSADKILTTTNKLTELLNIDFDLLNGPNEWQAYLDEKAITWRSNLEQLKDWYNWTTLRTKAANNGLLPVTNAFEMGNITPEEMVSQTLKGMYRASADFIFEQSPLLTVFNSQLFEDKIKRFRAISKKFEDLTKAELYARLAAKIPLSTKEASQSSEMGMLQKAIKNNGRALSIRKLFDSIPNLLPRLTPCMLMSPISVAQYFDAESAKFDLVIFDEASQIPTCEAVGAIARATNVIVVGDPKQMPPTNFFGSNNFDEDNVDKEDLESILDDCLALSMPSQHLLWHYRSKHESLIAFSNAKYYENKLLTFPSRDDIISKVRHVLVAGHYDKGKSRQNKFEAKAIIDEVVRRLSDSELANKSIGIVTFSSVQQTLIEDLLNEVFSLRPDLERIALESNEPIFIKNLENVQGDERDIILFSIGYGPDENGKVSHNFGPINREGGWRRLNVAVSRARYEMIVFSTLKSEQIDLNRTSSEGVMGLKAFLAYAEKGKIALPVRNKLSNSDGMGYEHLIVHELSKHGYEVHTQVGCSAYKIDLAIVDKSNSSSYILGVLTDGKNYQRAQTSKDREVTQLSVLHQLGWNIHKVWSTEWWEKPAKVTHDILEAIRLAENHDLRVSVVPQVSEDPEREIFINETTQIESVKNHEELQTLSVNESKADQEISNVYVLTYLAAVNTHTGDEFFWVDNKEKIKRQISDVLETEWPISKNLLCKRVLNAWNISRMGTRISSHFQILLEEMDLSPLKDGHREFYWQKAGTTEGYKLYRIPRNDLEKRDADDLPPEEVANAVNEILSHQISLTRIDLIRETAKLFGYSRVGTNVEYAMGQGINKAIELGSVEEKDTRVVFTG
jgi:very-short-patch-repair endonuclease